MAYTKGKWVYNRSRYEIESTSEWTVEPSEDEDGIPAYVISTFGSMGGKDALADIALICAAPDMLELLQKIAKQIDDSLNNRELAKFGQEVLDEIQSVIHQALNNNYDQRVKL